MQNWTVFCLLLNLVFYGRRISYFAVRRLLLKKAKLQTSLSRGFSALELQRQLGHKYYEAIWGMLHKLRLAMGRRDEQYSLSGQIELDEGFFPTEIP